MSRRKDWEFMTNNNGPSVVAYALICLLCGLLSLIFGTMKITGVVNYSWFVVVLPILFPIIVVSLVFLVALIKVFIQKNNNKKYGKYDI